MTDELVALTRNPLKEKLGRGELASCMIIRMSHGIAIGAAAANAGLDACYIDLEHSPLSLETTAVLCCAARAAGVVPLVRVPGLDEALVGRLLDGGAMGIIVPQIACAEQARQAVAAARYPPEGRRSFSSTQPLLNYRAFPPAQAQAAMNRSVFVAVMIESADAVSQIDAIAAVPGLDMLFLGAGDLSADLGIPGELSHPSMRAAYARIQRAADNNGKAVGLGGLSSDPALLAECLSAGARFVSIGTDLALMTRAIQEQVRRLPTVDC
ncbi:aldolase [Allopusillimonas soli]|uniref:Aldolase n=1 Tax=Allopusillimonas soli TaxID=659016 RepID=A0A853FGQ6_9BURK|nr:aldolase/citrate lyase family protein [Allopusillimonas soli]NYT39057.1 aldolase [Allopusillimonas soli]TEA69511.1 aldolase [Allopusillimonas soli]